MQRRPGTHSRGVVRLSTTALSQNARAKYAKVAKMRPRLRIYEVGVAYYGRSYEEGKNITWKDGVKAILAIIRFRLSD